MKPLISVGHIRYDSIIMSIKASYDVTIYLVNFKCTDFKTILMVNALYSGS